MGRRKAAPATVAVPKRRKPLAAGLAGALFSRVQQRVLGLMFGQPDRSFHASEIIRIVNSGSGAVQRELEKLTKAGILTTTLSANRKLYQANRLSPIFDELYGLVLKTMGPVEFIRRALDSYRARIKFAFVYGSVAKGVDTASSDIDLMIVGEGLAYEKIYATLEQAERALRRTVSPTLMTSEEWKRRRSARNAFLAKLLAQPKAFVIGGDDELQGVG